MIKFKRITLYVVQKIHMELESRRSQDIIARAIQNHFAKNCASYSNLEVRLCQRIQYKQETKIGIQRCNLQSQNYII
ncbi:unnamed protein product [Paramecium octaurelia]|uniref:Uncharacterized protein n=1 Tax=Paramecium octaurelia TaxID=43137 RepID=A0A8S1UED6_PAROT|nr:unnamed protein product [Paramecium octaurelia]